MLSPAHTLPHPQHASPTHITCLSLTHLLVASTFSPAKAATMGPAAQLLLGRRKWRSQVLGHSREMALSSWLPSLLESPSLCLPGKNPPGNKLRRKNAPEFTSPRCLREGPRRSLASHLSRLDTVQRPHDNHRQTPMASEGRGYRHSPAHDHRTSSSGRAELGVGN